MNNEKYFIMKKINLLLTLVVGMMLSAQIPNGYYDGTDGLTGLALKSKLHNIIKNHRDRGYSGLYTTYENSDTDNYYEKDGTVLDMYSENPNGKDAYEYTHFNNKCGNYSKEGDCYNREHLVPQSLFNKKAPMVSDAHFIVPTDGKVNGMRGNYPFGIVNNPSWTSKNGSKVGKNTTSGYSGVVFEPIDEFKGDIARMLFYFVTRYEDKLSQFDTGHILSTKKIGLENWELQVLLKWSEDDPISQREIDRNNAIYDRQKNRNPYIDHPEWVEKVWGKSQLATSEVKINKNKLSVYPNPVKDGIVFIQNWKAYKTIDIINMNGQKVLSTTSKETINVRGLAKGIYILKAGQNYTKLIVE